MATLQVQIQIENLGRFKEILETREQAVKDAAIAGVRDVLILGESEAKRASPVDTGRLRASIRAGEVRVSGMEASGLVGIDQATATNVGYAPFQEFGTGIYHEPSPGRTTPWRYYNRKLKRVIRTRGNKPHPFIRPAHAAMSAAARDLISSAVMEVLR